MGLIAIFFINNTFLLKQLHFKKKTTEIIFSEESIPATNYLLAQALSVLLVKIVTLRKNSHGDDHHKNLLINLLINKATDC